MIFYNKIAYHTLLQLIARSLATFANFLIIIMIGKTLGSFGLGQYNKVFAFIGIFSLFVDFGINASFLKLGRDNDVGRLILLRLLIAVVVFLVIQPLIIFLPYDNSFQTGFSPQEKLYIEIVASVLFLYAVVHSLNALFQKWQRFDLLIWPNLAYGVSALAIAFYAVFTHQLLFFFLATSGGLALYSVTAFFLAAPSFLQVNSGQSVSKTLVRRLFLKSLPIGLTLFLNILYVRADVLLLSFFRPTQEVGIYTLAYKFFEFPLSLSFFVMNALYPVFLQKHQENRRHFYHEVKKAVFWLSGFSLLILTLAFFFAPLVGLIRQDFLPSVAPFRILVFSYPIFFLSNLLLWVIITENKEKILPLVYGSSLAANVMLNLIFIPRFGYMASSAITIVCELFVLAFFAIFLNRFAFKKITNYDA